MKYIMLKVKKHTYRVLEHDIKRIHIRNKSKRPLLPPFDQNHKIESTTLTCLEERAAYANGEGGIVYLC